MANGFILSARAAALLPGFVPLSAVAALAGALSLTVLVGIVISLAVIIIVRHGIGGTGQA